MRLLENSKISKREKNNRPIYLYFIYGIILLSMILVILRIVFYYFKDPFFAYNRDVDFRTLHILMDNGLINYYKASSIGGFRAYYLYYWYFLFFPVYILPLEIGVYIWDGLRLITTIYIAKNVDKLTNNSTDKVIFFVIMGMGFFADAYLNNTNWLIQIFLFQSYIALKNDKKWLSGLLFTLAMYKIIVIVFPFVLLIVKKMKLRDLAIIFIPFAFICIPYYIFPDYFLQMVYNWTYIEVAVDNSSLLLTIYLFLWQGFQTAQLMFFSLLIVIFLESVKNLQWHNKFRILILLSLLLLNLSFPIILWPILYG